MYDTVQCVTSMILVVGTIEVVSVINLLQGSQAHCKFVFSPSLCIDTLVTGMSGTGNGALQKQGPCDSCKLSFILKEIKVDCLAESKKSGWATPQDSVPRWLWAGWLEDITQGRC